LEPNEEDQQTNRHKKNLRLSPLCQILEENVSQMLNKQILPSGSQKGFNFEFKKSSKNFTKVLFCSPQDETTTLIFTQDPDPQKMTTDPKRWVRNYI